MKFRLPQTVALELPGCIIDAKIIYTAIINQILIKKIVIVITLHMFRSCCDSALGTNNCEFMATTAAVRMERDL